MAQKSGGPRKAQELAGALLFSSEACRIFADYRRVSCMTPSAAPTAIYALHAGCFDQAGGVWHFASLAPLDGADTAGELLDPDACGVVGPNGRPMPSASRRGLKASSKGRALR